MSALESSWSCMSAIVSVMACLLEMKLWCVYCDKNVLFTHENNIIFFRCCFVVFLK